MAGQAGNEQLRAWRERATLSQEELAARLRVSSSAVRRWETGRASPQPEHRRRLCEVLSATAEDLGLAEVSDSTTGPAPDVLADHGMVEWLAEASGRDVGELAHAVESRARKAPVQAPVPRREGVAEQLLGYYGEDELRRRGFAPYRLELAGSAVTTSIVTRPDWRRLGVVLQPLGWPTSTAGESCRLTRRVPALRTPMSADLVRLAIDRLARAAQERARGQVLWNKPLYRLVTLDVHQPGQLEATFALDHFAHYALTYDLLEAETLRAVESGSPQTIRDALLPDAGAVVTFSDRLCVGGPLALFAIARRRREDFLLVVQRRSNRVLNVAGKLAVIPKGFHQHLVDAAEEVHIGTSLRRELEEELFGRVDYDEQAGRGRIGLDPYHREAMTEPMAWLEQRRACTFHCTAVGINLLTGNYEFAALITVPDEDFWERFGGECLPSWEASEFQTYSTRDPGALAELVLDPRWTEEGLFALVEGLRALAHQYPDRIDIPKLEVIAA